VSVTQLTHVATSVMQTADSVPVLTTSSSLISAPAVDALPANTATKLEPANRVTVTRKDLSVYSVTTLGSVLVNRLLWDSSATSASLVSSTSWRVDVSRVTATSTEL